MPKLEPEQQDEKSGIQKFLERNPRYGGIALKSMVVLAAGVGGVAMLGGIGGMVGAVFVGAIPAMIGGLGVAALGYGAFRWGLRSYADILTVQEIIKQEKEISLNNSLSNKGAALTASTIDRAAKVLNNNPNNGATNNIKLEGKVQLPRAAAFRSQTQHQNAVPVEQAKQAPNFTNTSGSTVSGESQTSVANHKHKGP